MNEKVDVLLATYNGEKYLQEQIDSILNQDYKNINLIISDDCSKDNTREILKEYDNIENIQIYLQENNLGYIKNFEFLLSKVQNELYMLSDQDDIWLPEKIGASVKKLQDENADLVFGDLEVVDENLETIYSSFIEYMKLDRKINKYSNSYLMQYLYNCITGCTILSKRKYLNKILPLPSNSKYMPHDYWIGLMVALEGKIVYIPEKYIKYRQHGSNQIGTDKLSHSFKRLEDVRNLFINVKLGIFNSYVKNNEKFPDTLQKLNIKSLEYFEMIQKKKNFNFKDWNIYHILYKNETFSYYISNFVILNLPFLAKGLFKIRHLILKMLGKR